MLYHKIQKRMRENPYDKTMSPELREKVAARKSFIMAQADAADLVHTCELRRKAHKKAWEKQKQEHHERRLEQAEEREDSEGCYLPVGERERRKQADDARFSHIKHEDQLLELTDHEDYLRGQRALRRRKRVRESEVTIKVEASAPTGPTGLQIWAAITGLFFVVAFLSTLKEGPGAIIMALPLFLIWAAIVRLPGWLNITSGGGVGRMGSGGGNAV